MRQLAPKKKRLKQRQCKEQCHTLSTKFSLYICLWLGMSIWLMCRDSQGQGMAGFFFFWFFDSGLVTWQHCCILAFRYKFKLCQLHCGGCLSTTATDKLPGNRSRSRSWSCCNCTWSCLAWQTCNNNNNIWFPFRLEHSLTCLCQLEVVVVSVGGNIVVLHRFPVSFCGLLLLCVFRMFYYFYFILSLLSAWLTCRARVVLITQEIMHSL